MTKPCRLLLLAAFLPALALSQTAPAPAPAPAEPPSLLAEGDAHWQRRAEGASGGNALKGPIDEAIASYEKAVAKDPADLDAKGRLMRAIYFKGEYTTKDVNEKKGIFDQGRKVGEEALALIRKAAAADAKKGLEKATPVELVPFVKGKPAVLACFYWAGVDWGTWALAFGKGAAVKQGAAAKIRDYAQAVILLDPAYEDGGGYRVLGRLHHQTPSVPFFTGWASRDEALKNLRLGVQTSPKSFITRLYLAEATWEYDKAKRPEAKAMLEALVADTPTEKLLVEDRKAQEDAKALLLKWK